MAVSTVPLPREYFHAILQELARHSSPIHRRDLWEPVADRMKLTPEQRAEYLPSGVHLRYRHRMGWSLHMLKSAGYAEGLGQGLWRIASAGRELLERHPQGFDDATLKAISVRARTKSPHTEDSAPAESDDAAEVASPEERIDEAVNELHDQVADDLLDRIGRGSPDFFERLVLQVLRGLGYGSRDSDLQQAGGSGDGGIDGIISLDALGLEKVYVQAKRWAPDRTVGRPDIQAFYGALAGRRANKGVFIATCSFSREALDFAKSVSDSIVLVDGRRLASLMIDTGVGVTHRRTIRLAQVDEDFFEDA